VEGGPLAGDVGRDVDAGGDLVVGGPEVGAHFGASAPRRVDLETGTKPGDCRSGHGCESQPLDNRRSRMSAPPDNTQWMRTCRVARKHPVGAAAVEAPLRVDGLKGHPEPQPDVAGRAGNTTPAAAYSAIAMPGTRAYDLLETRVDGPSPDPQPVHVRVPATAARTDLSHAT
jgi:hypothetical protein